MIKEKLWTQVYISITFISFLLIAMSLLLTSTLGLYATANFEVAASIAGLIISISTISSSVARLFTGRILAFAQAKKVLLFGLVFSLLSTVLYFFANSVAFLIAVRFIHGIGFGIAMTALPTMIAYIIPQSRKTEGIGNFMSAGVLAFGIGPFIGISLMRMGSFDMIYIICLLLGAICVAVNFSIKMPDVNSNRDIDEMKAITFKNLKLSDFFEKQALPMSAVVFTTLLAYSSVMTYLPLYAKEINLLKAASYYFFISAIGTIFTRPYVGRLVDKYGANIAVYPILVLFTIGMLMLSGVQSTLMLLTGAFLMGIGYGNTNSIGQSLVIEGVPQRRIGMAMSTYYISMDIAVGIGPYFLGLFIPAIGYRRLYLLSAFILVCGICLYTILHGTKEHKLKKPR